MLEVVYEQLQVCLLGLHPLHRYLLLSLHNRLHGRSQTLPALPWESLGLFRYEYLQRHSGRMLPMTVRGL